MMVSAKMKPVRRTYGSHKGRSAIEIMAGEMLLPKRSLRRKPNRIPAETNDRWLDCNKFPFPLPAWIVIPQVGENKKNRNY